MSLAEIYHKPSPEQLFQVASIGICLAKDQGKFKASKNAESAHIFLANELEYVEVRSEEEYLSSIHKFIGRIGKTGYKEWSMRLAEPYWISAGNENDGFRASYIFEWTDKNVVKSLKKMHAKRPEEYGESLMPEVIEQEIFSPDLVHAVNEFETVSAADCRELIGSMQAFSSASRYVMQYNR
jgi:hypothetical protein